MRRKRASYSATWKDCVFGTDGWEHDVELDVEYTIACDGIGSYEYWGARCFDAGTEYIEEAWATAAYLVRVNSKAKREDIPNIRGIRNIHPYRDRWVYEHVRAIDVDTDGVERAVERFQEEYDFENDLEDV